jgi:hypothetical protein
MSILLLILLPVLIPMVILFLSMRATRAFLGYNILAFGGIFAVFYAAHSIGIY